MRKGEEKGHGGRQRKAQEHVKKGGFCGRLLDKCHRAAGGGGINAHQVPCFCYARSEGLCSQISQGKKNRRKLSQTVSGQYERGTQTAVSEGNHYIMQKSCKENEGKPKCKVPKRQEERSMESSNASKQEEILGKGCFNHLSQGQYLSFCPSPTPLFRDEPMHVAWTLRAVQRPSQELSQLSSKQLK
ncbi:hypothetical protein Celaphus_00009751, partial [Cervus elaphus hippelaphus]